MNFKETMEYIEEISQYGSVLGLENMTELCRRLGNPQEQLKFVHIAGTNGKGSVLAYISTVLTTAGYKVGRYISPTISEYRERIQVNGRMITQNFLAEKMTLIRSVCDEMVAEGLHHPTIFEIETAMAFLYFLDKKCDIVVLETGMGGRLDATNIITTTVVAVIASISMDHMAFLGNTLEKITAEKTGIIKNNCYVISMKQESEAQEVINRVAKSKGCMLTIADGKRATRIRYGMEKQRFDYAKYRDIEIPLAGTCQIDNAVLAIETIRILGEKGFPVKEEKLRKGLKETVWKGRFSVIAKKPLFVVDGAHNEDAAKKLAESLRFYFTNKRIVYIMGVLKDKEYEKIIAETYAYADHIITVTPPNNPRALPAYELAQAVKEYHPMVTAAASLEEAVEMAYLLAGKEDVILAFGSLSYLGRLMEIVEKRK